MDVRLGVRGSKQIWREVCRLGLELKMLEKPLRKGSFRSSASQIQNVRAIARGTSKECT